MFNICSLILYKTHCHTRPYYYSDKPFVNVREGEMAKTKTNVETLYYIMWPKHPLMQPLVNVREGEMAKTKTNVETLLHNLAETPCNI
jgi:hypothetical protein